MTLNQTDFHLPYDRSLVERARELRKNMTPAEKKLWYDYLRSFPYRVLRQRPIAWFIVDFYCPALKWVIEVDGDSHFTPEGQRYDQERSRVLESYGLKIIRFTNDQVMNEFEAVCWALQPPIPPALTRHPP